jgi:hypothetical protein
MPDAVAVPCSTRVTLRTAPSGGPSDTEMIDGALAFTVARISIVGSSAGVEGSVGSPTVVGTCAVVVGVVGTGGGSVIAGGLGGAG